MSGSRGQTKTDLSILLQIIHTSDSLQPLFCFIGQANGYNCDGSTQQSSWELFVKGCRVLKKKKIGFDVREIIAEKIWKTVTVNYDPYGCILP